MRTISAVYQDPLDLVWLETASQIGIRIERDANVFAAWDGRGVLKIGTPETLDADDSLAQMIFHELCHALIEGPSAFHVADWGLNNDFDSATGDESNDLKNSDYSQNEVREHACLRLQAALADQFSLRGFFATTTDFRRYYDHLPGDPLSKDSSDTNEIDPAIQLAVEGWERGKHGPWSQPLNSALEMTESICRIVKRVAPNQSLWSKWN